MSHKNIQISLIAEKKNQVLNSLVLFGRTRETLIQEYTDQNRSVQGKNRLSWTRGFLLRSTEKNKTEQTSTVLENVPEAIEISLADDTNTAIGHYKCSLAPNILFEIPFN